MQTIDDIKLKVASLDGNVKKDYGLPKTIPDPHFIAVALATRGSAKTTLFLHLWHYFYRHIFNGLIVVSPTQNRDGKVKNMVQTQIMANKTVFTFKELNDNTSQEIKYIIKKKRKEYWKAVETLSELVKTKDIHPRVLCSDTVIELLDIVNYGEPNWLVFIDDCVGARPLTSQASTNPLNTLVLSHRHYKMSFFICVQKWTGINTFIRRNISALYLFKSRPNELNAVFKEYEGLEEIYKEYINDDSPSNHFVLRNFDSNIATFMLNKYKSVQ